MTFVEQNYKKSTNTLAKPRFSFKSPLIVNKVQKKITLLGDFFNSATRKQPLSQTM